jgi:hypothetical protein
MHYRDEILKIYKERKEKNLKKSGSDVYYQYEKKLPVAVSVLLEN